MKKTLLILSLAVFAMTANAQVGRFSVRQQVGPSTGQQVDRWLVPNAFDIIQFDATKKATSVSPAVALNNAGLGGMQHAKIALTAAQINGMFAAPVVIVPAPGVGHSIAVARAVLTMARTSTQFASGGAAIIQYDSTVNGGGTQACDSTIAATVFTGTVNTTTTMRNGAVISDVTTTDNKGLYISNATGAFTTGTGTATLDVWYFQT